MAKRPGQRPPKRHRRQLLDITSVAEIRQTRATTSAMAECQWDLYCELAYQRSQIESALLATLTQKVTLDFSFRGYQRAVKYKYSLHPLSTVGSLVDPGGRFNIGDIDPSRYPTFSALYLAVDKNTALQEALGQAPPNADSALTPAEIALTNPQSESIVSVSGQIEAVFDLREARNLAPFVALVKKFTISKALEAKARRYGLTLSAIRSVAEMHKALLHSDWRSHPMLFDVPAPSQIFGQLARRAGIGAVVYPSKLTDAPCLAVFPDTFASSTSYLELDGETPPGCAVVRVDSRNWKLCEKTYEEIAQERKLQN